MSLRPGSTVSSLALGAASAAALAAAPLDAQVPVGIGTRVSVTLTQALSSKSAKKGVALPIRVDADVVVRGAVVIQKGAPIFGTVTEARKAGHFGHEGALSITVDSVRAADGRMIPVFADLRDTTTVEGPSTREKIVSKIAGVVPGGGLAAGAAGAFKKGDDVDYAANTAVPVFTAAYVIVQVPGGAPAQAPLVPAAPAATRVAATTDSAARSAAPTDSSASMGPAPEALAFYSSMHTIDLALASLAAHLSATPAVRDFGQRVVREDTALLAQAHALAARHNITIPALPQADVNKMNELVKNLRVLSGTAFDEAILRQMYEFQQSSVDGLDVEDATPIGTLLKQTVPVWQEHMTAAAKLLVPSGSKR